MSSANRWLILAIVSSGLFLIVIDMTVLYTALPRLTRDLGASNTEKLWIVNIYPLVVAGLLPGLGALGDRLGHKHLFLAGLLVFGVASLVAAFSPTPSVLIGARVLLAVGAAMMMPATLSIIRLTFTDEKERAFAIGIWSAVASGGAALGPVIGGALLEFFWWGSVFLINVPVVAVATVAALFLLENRKGRADHPFDLIGSFQIMVGLVGVAYAIKEIGKQAPSLAAAAVALVLGVVGIIAFVRRQRASVHPMIDFALFRRHGFASGVAAAVVASAALIGVELVFSQRLQLVLGHSPLQAGLLILPIPVAAFFAGPVAGILIPRVGTARLLWVSLALSGLGVGGYMMTFDHAPALWLSMLAIMGIGIGAAITAASNAIMLGAPEERAGMAASIEEVSYELGGAIGIAIMGSVMSAIYTATINVPVSLSAEKIVRDSLDQALIVAEGMGGPAASQLVDLARVAFDHAFFGVIALAAILLLGTAAAIFVTGRSESRRTAAGVKAS